MSGSNEALRLAHPEFVMPNLGVEPEDVAEAAARIVADSAELTIELTDDMIDRTLNRRTDDPLHNRNILRSAIMERDLRLFNPSAISYVEQQALSEVAEADVHLLGAPMTHHWSKKVGDYFSFIGGSHANTIKGLQALDMNDPGNWHEYERRAQEEVEASLHRNQERRERQVESGGIDVFISPKGTHKEIDVDVAQSHGYDDRDMIRIHALDETGSKKTMYSFSVFDVSIEAWANMYSRRLGRVVEPLAIEVMKAANEDELFNGEQGIQGVLQDIYDEIAPELNEYELDSVTKQFDGFINKQEALLEQVQLYVRDRVEFEKDLALSETYAIGSVKRALDTLRDQASPERQKIIDAARQADGEYLMDDEVALAIWQLKVVVNFNRAGVGLGNERTMGRLRMSEGQDFLNRIIEQERLMLDMWQEDPSQITDAMLDKASSVMAEASQLECRGGCAVEILDVKSNLLSIFRAVKAGLKGKLFKAESLNKGSNCCSNPDITVDIRGSVYCEACGGSSAKGDKENSKSDKKKPTVWQRLTGKTDQAEDDEEESEQNSANSDRLEEVSIPTQETVQEDKEAAVAA